MAVLMMRRRGAMEHLKTKRWMVGLLIGLGCSIAALAMPAPAFAGGLRITIGIPAPVYVAPPPAVVYPAPVIVQPAPGIVYPPPVVYSAPYGVYRHHHHHHHPGLAKKYYGYHPVYGYKSYKHGKHHRHHHHDHD
jgi:hypothetical protein